MTQEGRKPLDSVRDETPSAEDKPSWDRVASERATGMKLVSPPRPAGSDSYPAPAHSGPPPSAGPASELGHGATQLDRERQSAPQTEAPNAQAIPQAPLSSDSRPPPAPSSRDTDQYLGCTIDNRYKVEALLGEGGMGVVYQCRHKIIDKKVAMKILRGELAREKEVTDRFLIEAKAASAIGNEHVIDISDFGQLPDGSAYFVMEFLDGQPLSSVLAGNTSLPPARIAHLGMQLAKGLAAAHKAGIVHRDLKPDNIFLITRASDSDFVKVLDFGIAKVSSAATGRLTQAGSVFGTPHYMSPEQAAGAPVDHRGDIYAMGVILYEMATGKLPFEADNFMAILTQHIYKQPASLRSITPSVPAELEAVILKCLSKRPEQRYQSMEEFAADMKRFETGSVPNAVTEMVARSGGFSVPADFWKQTSNRDQPPLAKRWPILVGALVIAAGLGLFLFTSQDKPAATPGATVQTAPAVAEPVPAAAPEQLTITSQVVLAVEPLTAHVFQGDKDLGSSPVVVDVPEGDKVDVEVRNDGYKPQTLTLDGSRQKLSIALEPVKQRYAAPARPAPAARPAAPDEHKKPRPGPQIGGGEIVNPWAGN
jgi:serine/threonine-protein kinase